MRIDILDPQGVAVAFQDGAFCLEEACIYRIHAPGASSASLDGRLLAATGDGRFVLDLYWAVGAHTLTLVGTDGPAAHPLRVSPGSAKLSPSLWADVLEDIESWLAGVSLGVAGPRHGAVGHDGVAAPLLVEALLPLLPGLESALREVLVDPRHLERHHEVDRLLRECRRVDPSTLAWISRHQEVAFWLDGWNSAEAVGASPSIPTQTSLATLDHPVNRYVAWLLDRVIIRLVEVADALDVLANRRDDLGWCTPRAECARAGAERLKRVRTNSWIARVPRSPISEAALLVIADDPRYARFHRFARRFCSATFRLLGDPGDPGAPVRPSFSIYEIWCFLALQQLLEAALPGWTCSAEGLGKLLVIGGSGEGARWTAIRDGEQITIEFNATFRSLYAHGQATRFSLSGKRRPDFVITRDSADKPCRWLVLDAKYRAGRENLADSLTSLHIYRDALQDTERGGRCVAGLLLAPADCTEVLQWFDPDWQQMHGLGIVALAPGRDVSALRSWIFRNLDLDGS